VSIPFRLAPVAAACTLFLGCATQPQTQTHAAVVPPAAAAAATAPGAAAGSTAAASSTGEAHSTRVVLEDKTLTDDEVKTLLQKQYKPEARNGKVYYCRREQQLGTRFSSVVCRTGEELKAMTAQSQEMTDQRQRVNSVAKGN
jgi:hypothetical protein